MDNQDYPCGCCDGDWYAERHVNCQIFCPQYEAWKRWRDEHADERGTSDLHETPEG
jgi:hypothetical protein